jgi:hypothetical protein
MTSAKRIIIATTMGLITGIICMFLASSGPEPMELGIKLSTILSRTLTGFMIGISALRLKWWLHGSVLGALGSIPMSLAILNDPNIMILTFVAGIIYGFLIELITSVVFKAKQKPAAVV